MGGARKRPKSVPAPPYTMSTYLCSPKKVFLVWGFFGRTTERDSELHINSCRKTVVHLSICACHPRAGAMLIFASLFLTSLFFASLFFASLFFASVFFECSAS